MMRAIARILVYTTSAIVIAAGIYVLLNYPDGVMWCLIGTTATIAAAVLMVGPIVFLETQIVPPTTKKLKSIAASLQSPREKK